MESVEKRVFNQELFNAFGLIQQTQQEMPVRISLDLKYYNRV
jgi:hypothetical protein